MARRLFLAGLRVVMTEIPEPLCIRRTVAFAEAVYDGLATVDGVVARLVTREGLSRSSLDGVAVVIDEHATIVDSLRPAIVVDARMLKKAVGARLPASCLVGGLGPGYVAGVNCDFAIETKRGHDLGRVIYDGRPEDDTGVPEPVMGITTRRALYSPIAGVFRADVRIGDTVEPGARIARVGDERILAATAGIVRGIARDGIAIPSGMKIADIDPRGIERYCYTISDRTNAIAGGVLEGVLTLLNVNGRRRIGTHGGCTSQHGPLPSDWSRLPDGSHRAGRRHESGHGG